MPSRGWRTFFQALGHFGQHVFGQAVEGGDGAEEIEFFGHEAGAVVGG